MNIAQTDTAFREAIELRHRQHPDRQYPGRQHFAASEREFTECERERFRHQSIMGALSRKSYAHAFQPGCSSGELTAQLARVCERVSTVDMPSESLERARVRCAHLRNIDIHCADVRVQLPPGPLDLIVFNEIGCYFQAPQLVRIACSLAARLVPGGEFLAGHGLAHDPHRVLHGDAVHCQLLAYLPLRWIRGERHDEFRIDSWQV